MNDEFMSVAQAKRELTAGRFVSAVSLLLFLTMWIAPASAVQFDFDGWNGQLDTRVAVGSAWRAQNLDPYLLKKGDAALIGIPNGRSTNGISDSGNLNYGKGSLVSAPAQINSELKLEKDHFGIADHVGVVASFYGWFDGEQKWGDVRYGSESNGYEQNAPLFDHEFPNLQKFSGVNLMKAYLFGTFHLGGHPLEVKVGRQVINWGTTLFAQGIKQQINATNVVALQRPGADRAAQFVPAGALLADFKVNPSMSIAAFYKWQWEESPLAPCGTFFAANDAMIGPTAGICNAIGIGTSGPQSAATGTYIRESNARTPPWAGQGGLAFHFKAERLHTDFGVYAMNVNANMPLGLYMVSGSGPGPVSGFINPIQKDVVADPSLTPLRLSFVYPENVQTYAITTTTTGLAGWILDSELDFSPNTPIMGNAGDVVRGAITGTGPWGASEAAVPPNTYFPLYDRFDKVEWDVNAKHSFDDVLGANKANVAVEVISEFASIPYDNGVNRRYGRGYVFGFGSTPTIDQCATPDAQPNGCQNKGYVSDYSWGYRLYGQLVYNDIFGTPIKFMPSLYFAEDINGVSIDYQLNAGRMTVAPSLKFGYKKSLLELDYVVFPDFNGFNAAHDRAYYALSYSVSF